LKKSKKEICNDNTILILFIFIFIMFIPIIIDSMDFKSITIFLKGENDYILLYDKEPISFIFTIFFSYGITLINFYWIYLFFKCKLNKKHNKTLEEKQVYTAVNSNFFREKKLK
jgi:hypothetical protein